MRFASVAAGVQLDERKGAHRARRQREGEREEKRCMNTIRESESETQVCEPTRDK